MVMDGLIGKASILAEALPYMQRFRRAIVVVKFGGSTMENPQVIDQTMRDIVLLECIGIRPVVVHGGGKAITAKLKELNIETHFVNGLRYTCEKSISVVDDVLHNQINVDLVRRTKHHGGNAIMISGRDMLKAEKLVDADYGFVGNIVGVNPRPVLEALREQLIPIITPLAKDKKGQLYNINADIAACKIAQALGADKLVFLSDVPGIMQDPQDPSTLIPSIAAGDVEEMIQSKVITGGMIPKIRSAVDAIDNGVQKVHMIDARIMHAMLLEIFTDAGIGTEIINQSSV